MNPRHAWWCAFGTLVAFVLGFWLGQTNDVVGFLLYVVGFAVLVFSATLALLEDLWRRGGLR